MITLYSKKACGKCVQVKNILESKKIEYIEKSLDDPDITAELIMNNVMLYEAPIVEKDGKYYTHSTGLLNHLS